MQKYKICWMTHTDTYKGLSIVPTNYYYIYQVMNAQLSEIALPNLLLGKHHLLSFMFLSLCLSPIIMASHTLQWGPASSDHTWPCMRSNLLQGLCEQKNGLCYSFMQVILLGTALDINTTLFYYLLQTAWRVLQCDNPDQISCKVSSAAAVACCRWCPLDLVTLL